MIYIFGADILAYFLFLCFVAKWICFLCAWWCVLLLDGVDVTPRKKDDISILPMRIT